MRKSIVAALEDKFHLIFFALYDCIGFRSLNRNQFDVTKRV